MTFVDTNSLLLVRPAFTAVAEWFLMPRPQVAVGERWVWAALKERRLSRGHHGAATVHYRTRDAAHYAHFGKLAPAEAKATVRIPPRPAAIDPHGFWVGGRNAHHHFAGPLAAALADWFAGGSVADLGCADGRYVRHLRERELECDGWDGNPHTPEIVRARLRGGLW